MTVRLEDWMPVYLKMVVKDGDYDSVDACFQALIEAYRDKREGERDERMLMGDLDAKLPGATLEEWEAFKTIAREARLSNLRKKIDEGLQSIERGELIDGKEAFARIKEAGHARFKELEKLRDKGLLPKPKRREQEEAEHRKDIREAFRQWKAGKDPAIPPACSCGACSSQQPNVHEAFKKQVQRVMGKHDKTLRKLAAGKSR